MKAIFIKELGQVVVHEMEIPGSKTGGGTDGISGSDFGSYRGTNAYVSYPRVPVHELVSKIVEIDENDNRLNPGMIITRNPYFNCIDAACFGARVLLIGVSKRNIGGFFFTIIQKKELNIYGSQNAMKKNFLELIDLIKASGIDLEKIVTNTYKHRTGQDAGGCY